MKLLPIFLCQFFTLVYFLSRIGKFSVQPSSSKWAGQPLTFIHDLHLQSNRDLHVRGLSVSNPWKLPQLHQSNSIGWKHAPMKWYLEPWSSRDKSFHLVYFLFCFSCCIESCFWFWLLFGSIQSVQTCSNWSWASILQFYVGFFCILVYCFDFVRFWVFLDDSISEIYVVLESFDFMNLYMLCQSHVLPRIVIKS